MTPTPPDPSDASRHATLEAARAAVTRRDWRAAFDALLAGDEAAPLDAADLRHLATAAYLVGREDVFTRSLERAHQLHVEAGDALEAARDAFWLGLHAGQTGEAGRASGWFGRMGRLVEAVDRECVEQGYLLLPRGHRALVTGALEEAQRTAAAAAAIGRRFGDPDLMAFALHLEGRARLRLGEVDEGLALLDEAMVAVTADELSEPLTGLIYCSVIGACREVYALGRAHEWTAALSAWCEQQPDMVAYAGECRIYRSEILQTRGAWHDALEEARRACRGLSRATGTPAAGLAHYQRGEVHRLRGEYAAAERAYRDASRSGREPLPGLALLRLAQGDTDAAAATISRALAEADDRWRRLRLLPAHVEIAIAADDLEEATRACDELQTTARSCARGTLDAVVAHARGAVRLAAGDATGALPLLRRAAGGWQTLDAPYEHARARELLGRACAELGDRESAGLEIEAARRAYEALGAGPDLRRLSRDGGGRAGARRRAHGLTPREIEVLALVATGRTNRAIGEALFISEKTVARHLANIFSKLGLSSRAAATAYAYEHELLDPPA